MKNNMEFDYHKKKYKKEDYNGRADSPSKKPL